MFPDLRTPPAKLAFLLEVQENETHSTPEVRLASFSLFLIFGTAERTPFAPKVFRILQRGKTLTADSAPLAS